MQKYKQDGNQVNELKKAIKILKESDQLNDQEKKDIIAKLDGLIGEQMTRNLIVKKGNLHQQLDWVVEGENGEWHILEVKNKDIFTKGDNFGYDATGLNNYQVSLRMKLYKKMGIRTKLLHICKNDENKTYWQYLDVLESIPEEEKYITPISNIKLYNLERFEYIGKIKNDKLFD